MDYRSRILLTLLLCTAPIFSFGQGTADRNMLLVKSAQSDAIEALTDDGTYLFSASDDGSIQVWNLQTGDIVQRIQIADLPIVKLAAEPGGLLSVLEKKRDNSFRLSEWEWKTAHRRFSVDLVDPPLFMSYSPQASFLVCALPRWNSLVFFDSSTGAQLPWPGDGFGIVDYALVSSKEERIMTYQSSTGALSYRNLSNGAEITRFATRQGLRNFQVVPDQTKTRAFASDGGNIVLIDLLSGSVLDSRPLPSPLLAILSSDSSGARAVALMGSPSTVLAQTFSVTDKPALAPEALEKMTFKNTMTSATLAGSQIFAGDGNGFVFRDLGKDSKAALADQIINPIVGLAASESAIYLSSPNATIKIATDMFSSAQQGVASRFDYRMLPSVPPNQGMVSLSPTSILLWDRSRTPKISILSTNNDSVTHSSSALPSRLLRVNAGKDYAVSVESSGQVRTWSIPDLKQGFTRNVLGALDADVLPDGSVLVGKGSSSALDSPLLKINPRTGETVPVPSSSQAVFLVKDSATDGLVYLMSIDGQAQGSVTSLQSWNPASGLVQPKALSSNRTPSVRRPRRVR